MRNKLISVIIPAHNESRYITETLECLRGQSYDRLEIIVIADACTDDTVEVAREFTDCLIETNEQNVSHARNLGFKEAKGDLLAFLDADVNINNTLLENSVSILDEGLVAVICPIKTFGGKLLGDRLFDCINNYLLLRLLKAPRGFLILPRDIFEEMHYKYGVFREDLCLGEDLHCGSILSQSGQVGIVDSLNKTFARRQIKQGYSNVMWQWLKAFYNSRSGKCLKINYPHISD